MSDKKYYIYILTNKRNGTLYVGVSNSLLRRSFEHKSKKHENSFTAQYDINRLVYYEIYGEVGAALQREKRLKKYRRQWKIELIEKFNPTWRDLFADIL